MSFVSALLQEAIAHDETVAILGCGSPLRGDDAAGSAIAEALSDLSDRACAFIGGAAPENLTGEIKRFKPGLLLVIDAIDMGIAPGEVRIISTDEIGGVSFSTHILPLPIIIDYLSREIGCRIVLLGIQIASLEFMADMTPAVAATVDALTTELRTLLQ